MPSPPPLPGRITSYNVCYTKLLRSELLARVQSERAGNLLRNPGLSVAEIGYRLGYAEPAAFTRAFTRWTGQSPLKWRQAYSG